jgi:hypothetical protein
MFTCLVSFYGLFVCHVLCMSYVCRVEGQMEWKGLKDLPKT